MTKEQIDRPPPIKYCPYCGANDIKKVSPHVPKCQVCRTIFWVTYSRCTRKSPEDHPATAGLPEQTGGPADPGERPGRVGGSEDPEHGK